MSSWAPALLLLLFLLLFSVILKLYTRMKREFPFEFQVMAQVSQSKFKSWLFHKGLAAKEADLRRFLSDDLYCLLFQQFLLSLLNVSTNNYKNRLPNNEFRIFFAEGSLGFRFCNFSTFSTMFSELCILLSTDCGCWRVCGV